MRAVVQRVRKASVTVEAVVTGSIPWGLLVYLGVAKGDTDADADYMAEKTVGLRIFSDDDGKMNLSVAESRGGILVVPQFTLLADARKGRRPSYSEAETGTSAQRLFSRFVEMVRSKNIPTETGIFQTSMLVTYTNDGPVTILLDSRKNF